MGDSSKRTRRLLRQFDRITFFGALCGIILCISAYFTASYLLRGQPNTQDFVKGLAIDLTVAFLLFAGSYFALKQIEEIKFEERADDLADRVASRVMDDGILYTDCLADVPWKDHISESSRIVIYAQYCDAWIAGLGMHFRKFFEKGGQVEIVLPAWRNPEVIASIRWRQPQETDDKLRQKIVDSYERLFALCAGAHKDARVTVHFVDHPMLNFGVRFDGAEIVLSWYEHIRGASGLCPAVYVDLARKPSARRWFEKEWTGLTASAVESISSSSPVPGEKAGSQTGSGRSPHLSLMATDDA